MSCSTFLLSVVDVLLVYTILQSLWLSDVKAENKGSEIRNTGIITFALLLSCVTFSDLFNFSESLKCSQQ